MKATILPEEKVPLACLFENPNRLASLQEILNYFMVWQLAKAMDLIRQHEDKYRLMVLTGAGQFTIASEEQENDRRLLAYCRDRFQSAEMQHAVNRIDGPFRIAMFNPITFDTLHNEFRVLRETVEEDLAFKRFTFIPDKKVSILDEEMGKWYEVWRYLPDTQMDSTEAIECYALGKNTAAVFHAMRVAEHCLRSVAVAVGVSLTHKGVRQPIDLAEWDKIIVACNNQIAKDRQMLSGHERKEKLSIFSDAASHCMYMKDIWRNDISHTGKTYTDPEALEVIRRVRSFACSLAGSQCGMMKTI